jgi:acyl carrier protein
VSDGEPIAGRVRELLAQILDLPPASVGPGFSVTSAAGWTSLNHLMLVSQLEAEFQVLFSNAEIQELTSFDRIVAAVIGHRGG